MRTDANETVGQFHLLCHCQSLILVGPSRRAITRQATISTLPYRSREKGRLSRPDGVAAAVELAEVAVIIIVAASIGMS